MRSFAKLPDRNTDAQPDVTLAWRTAPPQKGEAGKLKSKTGAKRLKRSRSPYTRRTSLPSDQDLLESHVANHYDEKAPELDSAFSLPQAVYPKPARRSSSGGIKRLLGERVMTIESKGTQATLHSRALRDTREPKPEPFNMRALVRELQVPGSAGSADSGTSSLGPAKVEVLTLPDIRPARVPGVMKRRSRSGGTSCNFSRMIRSSTESIDSLTGAIELQRPSTGRRQRPGSAPGHGRRHRPVSAPSRPRHVVRPVPDLVLERPTTCLFNIELDPAEHRDLADQQPEMFTAMVHTLTIASNTTFQTNDTPGYEHCQEPSAVEAAHRDFAFPGSFTACATTGI